VNQIGEVYARSWVVIGTWGVIARRPTHARALASTRVRQVGSQHEHHTALSSGQVVLPEARQIDGHESRDSALAAARRPENRSREKEASKISPPYGGGYSGFH